MHNYLQGRTSLENSLTARSLSIDRDSGGHSRSGQVSWYIAKLIELGVNEKWLLESNLGIEEARDLLMGLLYLREKYITKQKEEGF